MADHEVFHELEADGCLCLSPASLTQAGQSCMASADDPPGIFTCFPPSHPPSPGTPAEGTEMWNAIIHPCFWKTKIAEGNKPCNKCCRCVQAGDTCPMLLYPGHNTYHGVTHGLAILLLINQKSHYTSTVNKGILPAKSLRQAGILREEMDEKFAMNYSSH